MSNVFLLVELASPQKHLAAPWVFTSLLVPPAYYDDLRILSGDEQIAILNGSPIFELQQSFAMLPWDSETSVKFRANIKDMRALGEHWVSNRFEAHVRIRLFVSITSPSGIQRTRLLINNRQCDTIESLNRRDYFHPFEITSHSQR